MFKHLFDNFAIYYYTNKKWGLVKEQLKNLYVYLLDKNLGNITLYDLSKEVNTFDYAIVATIPTTAENKELATTIMKDFGIEKFPEGYNKGDWIVFDFDKIVLHLFIPQIREKYNLDKLWQLSKMKL